MTSMELKDPLGGGPQRDKSNQPIEYMTSSVKNEESYIFPLIYFLVSP